MSSGPMILVENLVKSFGSFRAVDGVSFRVDRGEVVGLLGPNGAGKTTTMRIMTGAMPPTEGRVELAGHDVAKEPIEVKRRVGYLPEFPPLYPEMSVRAYLRFVAELRRVPRVQRDSRIEQAMERCAVTERANQPIEQLSKGYRQRVGLAQAILHEPDVLILDEPTSGLDPRQIIEVRDLIRELAGERTVVLSSHILSEVAATCGRLIIMSQGRVVATETPAELTRRLTGTEQVTVVVRGPGDSVRDRLAGVEGVARAEILGRGGRQRPSAEGQGGPAEPGQPVEADGTVRIGVVADPDAEVRAAVAASVVEAGWELLELRRAELTLEEIFLQLTADGGARERHREAQP